jgi:hypothetical protein
MPDRYQNIYVSSDLKEDSVNTVFPLDFAQIPKKQISPLPEKTQKPKHFQLIFLLEN